MKLIILSLFFLFAFAICVQGQVTSQRVIYTMLNPPTVCVPGKIYTNSTVKKSWLGGSDTSCNPYAMGSSAGPTDATYITQTPNGTLSAEQALSTLPTGPLANTTTTGVLRGGTAVDQSIPVFCSDAGSTDAYACSLSPTPTLVTGTHYRFKANTANTGVATINFNSLGAVTIKKVAGGITTDLADNDIRANQWVDVIYDGTNMQMQSTLGNAAGASPSGSDGDLQMKSGTSLAASLLNQTGGNVSLASGQFIVPVGTASAPSLKVGSNGAGLFEEVGVGLALHPGSLGYIRFYNSSGSAIWHFHNATGDFLNASGSAGQAEISHAISTSTIPIYTFQGSLTTGVGSAGTNQLSLIAGGVETVRVTATGMTISGGTPITKHLSGTATLDFANLAAIGCEDLTVTVTGAALGDTVALGVPNGSVVANGTFTGWVSAADTVTIRFCTVVSGNPASGTFRADVWGH